MVTFSSFQTKRFAVLLEGSNPFAVYGKGCCLGLAVGEVRAPGACAQPPYSLGVESGWEVAPENAPVVGGGLAGSSTITAVINGGIMLDAISVKVNGTEVLAPTTSGGTINVAAGSTSLEGSVIECFYQSGGWISAPNTQGTDYFGSLSWSLWVWSDDTDIIL